MIEYKMPEDQIPDRSDIVQPLALTLGEPAGIGPDLALAVWRRRAELDIPRFYIVADADFLHRRAARLGLDVPIADGNAGDRGREVSSGVAGGARFGVAVTAEPGQPGSVERAGRDRLHPPRCRRCHGRSAAAVVTNPVAKNVLYIGFAEPGHTEFLATLVQRGDRQSRCGR